MARFVVSNLIHYLFDQQIELVVDKLREEKRGRALVLLPQPYTQKVVPNSVRVREVRQKSVTSEDDQVLCTVH